MVMFNNEVKFGLLSDGALTIYVHVHIYVHVPLNHFSCLRTVYVTFITEFRGNNLQSKIA